MSDLGNKAIMAENIQRLMDSRGIDRNKICADLGLKYTTFTDWVKGNTDPKTITVKDIARFEKQLEEAKNLLARHDIIMKEVSRLNAGTVAIVSQIRTVSKIRIQNPRYPKDALYNMRVDRQATDKIRAVMKDLYNIK